MKDMNELKKNKPNIRFPEFTDDWEQRKFGDVGSVAMCKRIFKEQTSEEGDKKETSLFIR